MSKTLDAVAEESPRGPLVVPTEASSPGGVRLTVVVPTLDERENVRALALAIRAVLAPVLPGAFEIVVVDDDSADATWREALDAMREVPELRVVRRRGERGLATAVVRGWQVARGDVLGVIDGDLQHPPEVLRDLWREIERGADLVAASRHVAGGGVSDWSLRRRVVSRGAQALGILLLPRVVGRLSDPMSGYFLVRRAALAGRTLSPLGYKLLLEVVARGRVGVVREVPYTFRERDDGGSKMTGLVWVAYVRHLLRLRARS